MVLESGGMRGVNLLYPWLLGPIQGIVVVVPIERYQACLTKYFAGDLIVLCLGAYALTAMNETAIIVAALWTMAFTCLRFWSQRVVKIHISTVTAVQPAPVAFYLEHACHFLGVGLMAICGLADWEQTGPLARTFGILLILLACILGATPVLYAKRFQSF